MPSFETSDVVVTYKDDEATKQAVFDRVMAYFLEHEMFHGEGIHQCDATIIDAPSVLSDIADDILCFKIDYKDE